MAAESAGDVRSWLRRGLGTDSPRCFALFVALFVVYGVAERVTRMLVEIDVADLSRSSLVVASLLHQRVIAVGVGLLAIGAVLCRSTRLFAPWTVLQHGRVLRLFAGSLLVLLAWQGALYDYNWFAGRTHLLDRVLVVVLAVASLIRPTFLLAFVVVFRIVGEQFLLPFGTSAGRNIDQVLVIVLVVIAAVHVLYVMTGSTQTAGALVVVAAALAAHFFIPGKGKVGMGWLMSGDPANLPLSSFTTGWLGHTDGGWAELLSRWYRRFSVPMKIATLGVELGSVVAVAHPRLTRLWLPTLVVFHVMVFVTTGFWFGSWIVVELGLLAMLCHPALRPWVAENATPARGAVAVLAVFGASVLFHPPGLAWLDAPVSYGYQIEAIGESGTAYHVPLSAFAPLDQHLAFDRVQFSRTVPASGAYGAVTSAAEYEALEAIDDFDQLAAYEGRLSRTTATAETSDFIQTFLDRTAARPGLDWSSISAPSHFWTSRGEPEYDFQEPLRELDIYRIRAIHRRGDPEYRRELVLHLSSENE